MELELIRPIVKLGNSAGVVLPREWLNGKARVELITRPLDIKREIFEILEDYLYDIIGIYLTGSYARGEETQKSDIDVLVITNKVHKKIEKGRYSIILISEEGVKNALENNALPIIPMIKEARSLLNDNLINNYKDSPLTRKNLNWHIEITKSALNVNREIINLDRETNSICSDAVAYSLVLYLRGVYIIDCLIKSRLWSNKEFLRLIKKISGSSRAYEGYLRVKNDEKMREDLPIEEAEKIYNHISINIIKQEKWAKAKKE